jgi:hypothetical protein
MKPNEKSTKRVGVGIVLNKPPDMLSEDFISSGSKDKNMKKDEIVFNSAVIENKFELGDCHAIVFLIGGDEVIKINEEGFFYKGNLVESDKEIYYNFKEWVDLGLKGVKENDE